MSDHGYRPIALVAAEGAAHGALCLWLYADGQAPSFVGWPVAPERYYLLQGLTLPLLMPALWWIAYRVTARLAGVDPGRLAAPLSRALALPTLVLLVIPDVVAYAIGGMAALTLAARAVGPLLLLGLIAASVRATRRALPELRAARAALSALAGLLTALVLGGLVIR